MLDLLKINKIMGRRKTIDVLEILEYGNYQLSRTDDDATKEFKIGVIAMIESVLHRTDNYNGFMFISNSDSDVNTLGYYSRKYFSPKK
jgi:hypothetical protein